MRLRFDVDEWKENWLWPIVIAVALPFQTAACQATEPVRLQETNSTSTVRDFQDVKQEVGYSDPQRFGKVQPTILISWILIGTGIWLLLVIFLFALFYRSPADKIWLAKEEEDVSS